MTGNFMIGLAVLAPAGMIRELAADLGVTIQVAGLLIAYGAVVLCIGSPTIAWAASRMARRRLLGASLALVAAGQAASALAPDYNILLAIRLVTLAAAAVFTPLAAGTIGLIVPERERASRVAFVFMGWALALAIGLPLITFMTSHLGWRATFAVMGVLTALAFLLLLISLPKGLVGAPVFLRSWLEIARNPRILLLLQVTLLWVGGLYVVFPYVAPLLAQLVNGDGALVATFFVIIGVSGFIGNAVATRIVGRFGSYRTMLWCTGAMALGMAVWSLGSGSTLVMALGFLICGSGFAATNSMGQARLIEAAPPLAAASVALNTSWLYIGQALGSWLGGELFQRGHPIAMGWAATAAMAGSFVFVVLTREKKTPV